MNLNLALGSLWLSIHVLFLKAGLSFLLQEMRMAMSPTTRVYTHG